MTQQEELDLICLPTTATPPILMQIQLLPLTVTGSHLALAQPVMAVATPKPPGVLERLLAGAI